MARTSYKVYETQYPYFITISIVDWLPVFSITDAAEIILESLAFHQNKRGLTLYAYVIMENHMHLIAQSDQLQKNIRTFKSYTARRIIDFLKKEGHGFYLSKLKENKLSHHRDCEYQFWQEGYHPKQIMDDAMMQQKMEYIHYNPVKRGYVTKPEYWRYSSAQNYVLSEGLISITKIRE
ncbi:REP-associated tyrosine transposase [Fodinibius halophilus]|uniref:Transposase n=1 Tax=Fodinibius halophilus TaxID=1736908 RepID=A0A6M1SZ81_9BACT|nr:transposase [Fodinibius halophilus]NGP86967.1 transposase [Fodinibius halophilus]